MTKKSKNKELCNAILMLKTPAECKNFLEDLCTPTELEAMEDRWAVAHALSKNLSYREIAKQLEVSTVTVTRVARSMKHGTSGYEVLLQRTQEKK